MEITIDLQRILWHELGHFCVDLLDTEANSNFSINSFKVSYYSIAISDKWGGSVTVLPSVKFEVLIEDLDKTSFAILNLISGCIFQTIFLKEIIESKVSFKDCFSLKDGCAGKSDCLSFHQITSRIRNRYGRNEKFIQFSEAQLFNIYYNLVVENLNFLKRTNELVTFYKDKIFKAYEQSENKDEFHYSLNVEELESLKKEFYQIISETSLKDTLINLKEQLKEKILGNSNLRQIP